jgi:hypothetical protein
MNRISRVTTGGLAMAAILLLSLASGSVLMHAGESSMKTKPNANEVGIWKAYSPRGMKGELNNYDPIGLIAGALIHADCSLNWRDPDNGKLYCFSSAASLLSFQEWPKTNSRKANEAFERIKKEHPQS